MASISRSYRPRTFADVTGQEGVKETLRLEVATGKLGNAYLFGGPRGVGKTTTARIFAKALNCLDLKNGEPCDACASCLDFAAGKMLDVIEMDAASNTGVENVREAIIEHVRFAPHRKFKVYILDEAHMLSNSSWNALLKTVEEPPAYAKFIFITTEVHRVPATIVSRCQRFDFKRIPDADLAKRIRSIAKEEGLKIDDAVLASIVAKADGCLRDGETLLGQLASLGESKITPEIASLVLPLSRLPVAANLLAVWSKRSLDEGLTAVSALEEEGIPLAPVFDDLIQAVRLLLLAHDSSVWKERLKSGDEGQRAVSSIVGAYPAAELADMALLLMERRRDAKQGADPRFCLELAATAVVLSLLPNAHKAQGNPTAQPKSAPPVTPPTKSSPSEKPIQAPEQGNAERPNFLQFRAQWPAILRAIEQVSTSLALIMNISKPVAVEGDQLTLQFEYAFHKDKALGDMKNRQTLDEAIRKVVGSSFKLEGTVTAPGSVSEVETAPRDAVSSIMQVFGGALEEGAA